jgi:hypothetical protein
LAPLPPLTPLIGTTRTPSVSADGVSAKAKAPASKQAEAFRQFESFILQSFIETMLAEKLADQISRSGGIGIAQKIAGPQVASAPPATRGGGAAEAASASATQPLDHLPLIRTYRSGEPS